MKLNKTFKTIGSMTIITVFAKLSGLLRVSLFANLFGTTEYADIFLGASRLPIMFFELTLGAAILSTFIPIFNKKLTIDGKEAAAKFANNFISITTIFTFIICLLGVIFARQIVGTVLGFEGQALDSAAEILRILFPVIIFTALAFTSVGILQSHGEFNIPAAISLVSNSIMIAYFLIFGRNFGIVGIAVAMLIGWSMQFLIQVPSLIKKGFRYKFVLNLKDSAIRDVVKLAIPVLISSWVHPIGVFINVIFAGRIEGDGYIAGLEFANSIYIIGVGVFTLAVTNFIFPKLSRLNAEGDNDGFAKTVKTSISHLAYVVIPVMALFVALAAPIIQTIYARGEFGEESVALVSNVLRFYSFGMVAFAITEILNRTFFAMQDGKTPMFASIIGIACNVALSAYLMLVQGLGVWALALSAAVGMTVTATILMIRISLRKKGILGWGFVLNLLKTLICGVGASAAAFFAYRWIARLLTGATVWELLAKLSLASAAGLVVYLGLCWIGRIKEQQGILGKLLGKKVDSA